MHWPIFIEEAAPRYVRNCVWQRGFVLAAIKRVVTVPKGFPFVKIAPLDCSYQDLVAQRRCLVSGRKLPALLLQNGSSRPRRFKNRASRGIFIEPLSMELAIPLSKKGEPLFRQVYLGLRQAILSGAFPAGERLPSTRDLAEQLDISRTVVLLAYDQLLAEGFVVGRGGPGTYSSPTLNRTGSKRPERAPRLQLSPFGIAAPARAR